MDEPRSSHELSPEVERAVVDLVTAMTWMHKALLLCCHGGEPAEVAEKYRETLGHAETLLEAWRRRLGMDVADLLESVDADD
jgi:hypothetical protein